MKANHVARTKHRGLSLPALCTVSALLFASVPQGAAQILTFEFSALVGNETTATSNSNDPGLTSSTISRGAGLTASNNSGRFNATSWALTSIANAVNGNDYMEFTITPNSGKQFSVTTVVVQWQRSSTGNVGISLRNSVDSYASDIDGERSVVDSTSTQTFTWNVSQGNSSSPVTYRLYSWAKATTGSGGPGDGSGNDIVVNGAVTDYSSGSPLIGVTGSTSPLSTYQGTASSSTSVDVSGSDLTADITATAPTGFEVSNDDTTWGSTTTFAQSGGSASGTLYVRLAATAAVGPHSENVVLTSTGATTVDVAVSGTVIAAVPTITLAGVLDDFSTAFGEPSSAQTLIVSGIFLTDDITVSVPNGFEVSTAAESGYAASLDLSPIDGSVAETALYVRLTGAAAGSFSGDVSASTNGGDTKTAAVLGTVNLTAPTTAPATDVSTDGFTANWSAVSGATGYEIDVFSGRQSSATSRLIISQYVETDAGNFPKAIELLNVSDETIDFSVDNLIVYVGFNGGTPIGWVTNMVGTLAPGKVLVVGTSDIGTYLDTTFGAGVVPYKYANFTFNGNDALVVELGGVTEDVFGTPGTDPGASWSADGISTANQNLSLLADTLDGDTDGWTDPSLRFETVSTTPSAEGGLAGFGQAPFPLEIYVEQATEVAGGTTTSYAVTGLQPGTEYTYVVRAVDSASGFASANSDERDVTTLAADTAPTVTVFPIEYSVDENEVVSFLVTVFDEEDHAITLDMDLDAASLTPTATTNVYEFAWTPTSAGVTSVTFVATANGLQSTPVEVTINVLEAQGGDPVQPTVANVAADSTQVVVTFDVAAGLENDVTYELVSATALGTDPATWTPVAATYAAVDGDTATLTAALPAGDTRFFHVKASR